MGYDVRWLLNEHIILTTLWGEISVDETEQALNQATQYLNTTAYIAHDLIDLRTLTKYPPLLQMMHMRSFLNHPHLGWVVVVSNDKLMKFFVTAITGLAHSRFNVCTTIEECLLALTSADLSLPRAIEFKDMNLGKA